MSYFIIIINNKKNGQSVLSDPISYKRARRFRDLNIPECDVGLYKLRMGREQFEEYTARLSVREELNTLKFYDIKEDDIESFYIEDQKYCRKFSSVFFAPLALDLVSVNASAKVTTTLTNTNA